MYVCSQETLLNAVKQSQLQQPSTTPLTQPNKWTYASAFLYSLTLITTIGYGGISPSTQWGRVVAVVYALFGIPIVLLYLSAIGEGLSSGIRCVFRKIRLRSKTTNKATPSDINFSSHTSKMNKLPQLYYPGGISHPYQLAKSPSVPISICILILIMYMGLGTLLFHKIQEWSVLESFYFCFTALGTIGFGELAPNGHLSQYIASLYILVGMAVVAMCFSLIQTEIILWLRRMGVQDQVLPPNEEISLVSISPKSWQKPNDILRNPSSSVVGITQQNLTQYNSLPRRSYFQRNTPVRRSTGNPENRLEYFVPRSVSEFNIAGMTDLEIPIIRRSPSKTVLCPPPPPPNAHLLKPREKMVTFEDESTNIMCPHGIPTTSRNPVGTDAFMWPLQSD